MRNVLMLLAALLASPLARADSSVAPPAAGDAGERTGGAGLGCERLPASWHGEAMANAAREQLGKAAAPSAVRVLAWQSEKDDRPLYLDSAILWLKLANGSEALAHVYRHPREERAWHLSMVYDAPFERLRVFAKRPTRDEVDAFLKRTWWTFHVDSDFTLLGAEVCKDAWQEALGAPPWHAYGTPAPRHGR
jgi:hypothetical protein